MNSDDQDHDLTSKSDRRAFVCALCGGLVLLGALTWVVLHSYSIKAFSDPYNYLMYANNLAEEVMTSRWPFVYPAFLWVTLKLAGPFFVFLSNLPLLLAILALIGYLTWSIARETDGPVAAALVSLATVGLLIGFKPDIFIYLTNPYRDPLSHVFLLASCVLFIRFLQQAGDQRWMLAVSGLLLGLAFSVRETSLLMVAPMGLTGLFLWMTGRKFHLGKAVAVFALFLAIGAMPLLIQTYVTTHQVMLPPQAVREGYAFPGFNPATASDTARRAFYFYRDSIGPGLYLVLGAGLVFSLVRRNPYLILFILPSAMMYAVLYSFYRAFIERYFLIVTLFGAPLAAYGIYHLLNVFLRLCGCRSHRTTAIAALTLLLSGWAVYRLFSLDIPEPRFRIADARQFTRDINALVPDGALIVCSRNLCEVISYFTHAKSYQLTGMINDGPRSDLRIADHIAPMLKEGRTVYFMRMNSAEEQSADETLLRRFFDLEPVATMSREQYHLDKVAGRGSMTLCMVKEWTNHVARIELGPWLPGSILRIDAGTLWGRDDGRTTARLTLNGNVIDERLGNGTSYYILPASVVSSSGVLEINSDAPLSSMLKPTVLQPDGSIEMDFGVFSKYSHDEYLSPTILEQRVRNPLTRIIQGEGSIRIPMLWPTQDVVTAELFVRVARYAGSGPLPLAIADDEEPLAWHSVEEGVLFQSIPIWIKQTTNATDAVVRLSTGTNNINSAARPFEWIEMDRLMLHHVPPQTNFSIDIGSGADNPYLLDGFYKCEKHDNQSTVRWTGGRAKMIMNLPSSPTALSIGLTHWIGLRPPTAPEVSLQMLFNGHQLTITSSGETGGKKTVQVNAMVPAEFVIAGANILEIECAPWRPHDTGSSADERQLGILLDRVDVAVLNSKEDVR